MYNQNYDYLEHHGILGQRWGVRRYQNKDGSLTPAGAKRAAKLEKKLSKLKGETKTSTSGESVSSEDHKKYVESSGKKMSEMSTRELNEFANRYAAMQRYSETQAKIKESQKTTGQKLKEKVIKSAKQAGEEYLDKMVKKTISSVLDKAVGDLSSKATNKKTTDKQKESKKDNSKSKSESKETTNTSKEKSNKSKIADAFTDRIVNSIKNAGNKETIKTETVRATVEDDPIVKKTTDFVNKYYYTPYTPLLGIEDKKNK